MPHFGPTFFSFPSFFFFHFVNPKLTNPKPKRGKKEDQTGTLFMYKKKKDKKVPLIISSSSAFETTQRGSFHNARFQSGLREEHFINTRARARSKPYKGKTAPTRGENSRAFLSVRKFAHHFVVVVKSKEREQHLYS